MQISGNLGPFRALKGWRLNDLPADLMAGLTLAAVAVPEQIATARLGGFPPEIGFFAFIAGTLGFAVFGASRMLSVGADSTITPIFAGGLAVLAASGSPAYAAQAAMLAILMGAILMAGGLFRMGWIANLLSVPVTTGFLAGIAIHILISQLPALLGLSVGGGDNVPLRIGAIAANLGHTNIYSLALGLGVFAATYLAEKINPRIPGALAGLVIATLLAAGFDLKDKGVAVLGVAKGQLPHAGLPDVAATDVIHLIPLALIVAIVVMVQTATTTRAFAPGAGAMPDVNRDFLGVGAGSLFAGLAGAFPVNASPPRTAVVSESGGRSQICGFVAALIVGLLVLVGPGLLAAMPAAAFAGILLFIAQRITRLPLMLRLYRQSKGELALVIATFVAITLLPIQIGVAAGVGLSVLQGVWTVTRTRAIEFARIPGTTIWWPPGDGQASEKIDGVMVLAFQAPLSFLNAYGFRSDVLAAIHKASRPLRFMVLEAGSVVEIDFTASQILANVIEQCRAAGIVFALARLESVRGQEPLEHFGILQLLGKDCVFRSVEEAVDAFQSGRCPRPG